MANTRRSRNYLPPSSSSNAIDEAGDVRPIPDPTRLTTQLVNTAIASFREVMETRLNAIDVATKLTAEDVDRIVADADGSRAHLRSDVDKQMASLERVLLGEVERVRAVSDEKFGAVYTQFAERDERIKQTEVERRISLDAALAAQKEAVAKQQEANALAIGKSEDYIKERLDGLTLLMQTSIKSLEDKIGALKERVDQAPGLQLMSQKTEQQTTTSQRQVSQGQLVAIVVAALLFVGLVVNIFVAVSNKGG